MKQSDWDVLARYGVTPENLSVGGSLDLIETAITSLPENLSVGRSLDLSRTAIPVIYTDDRGYELRKIMAGDAEWFAAGCRLFESRADAMAHWGSPDYPDRERGAAFCAAIRDA